MEFTFADLAAADSFKMATMIDYVDAKPYIPQNFSAWLPWNTQGVYLNDAYIELRDGTLSLIPEAERGAAGDSNALDNRKVVPVRIPHYPQTDKLMAESLRGVRAFGSDLMEAAEEKRNEILDQQHKRNLMRWEWAKGGALTGIQYEYDKAGNPSARLNWYDIFGVQQQVVEIDLDSATTDIVGTIIDAKGLSEDALGMFDASGYKLICGKNFGKKITAHPNTREDYQRWNSGQFLRDDNRNGFPLATDVDVVTYSRGKIAGHWLIDPDAAYLCPIADGMYQVRHAPGVGFSTLGEKGLPEYFRAKPIDDDAIELKSTTDAIAYTQRPAAIIKLVQP